MYMCVSVCAYSYGDTNDFFLSIWRGRAVQSAKPDTHKYAYVFAPCTYTYAVYVKYTRIER
jgi:hypothetical protein